MSAVKQPNDAPCLDCVTEDDAANGDEESDADTTSAPEVRRSRSSFHNARTASEPRNLFVMIVEDTRLCRKLMTNLFERWEVCDSLHGVVPSESRNRPIGTVRGGVQWRGLPSEV
jgi:hypothetical protein